MSHLVFVYGTLRRGQPNNSWLNDMPCLGEARTVEQFTLRVGRLPYVTPEPRYHVTGEVYAVDDATLRLLDQLEGHPIIYERQLVPVRLTEGAVPCNAWLYVFHPTDVYTDFHQARISPTGDYVADRRPAYFPTE